MTNLKDIFAGMELLPEQETALEGLKDYEATTFEDYESIRAGWMNASVGSLDGAHCVLCGDKGYTVRVADNGALACVECACMAKRRSVRNIEKSGLDGMLEKCTFDNFLTPEDWQQEIKQSAQKFLSDGTGQWFVAAGNVGCGKTHICTAICSELLNGGLEVSYMRWKSDSIRIKASTNDSYEYNRMVGPLKRIRVLYIDDFWKGTPTQADINLAFDILDTRYGNRKNITIISSEKTVEEMMEVDEAVGSRIYERSKNYYWRLKNASNWRLKG